MADQVKALYPEFVNSFGGFMTVDMDGLLTKMEAA